MRDLILTIIVFSGALFALARPSVGLLVWSWLGYMNPHRMTWGFAYDFPFVYITAVLTMIGTLFGKKERNKFPWSSLTVVWMLFVLWMCVTTETALIPELAEIEWSRSMKIQLMVLVTMLVVGTEQRLKQLVWVMALSLGYFGIKGGIFVAATAGSYRVWGPPGSFVEGNNELALALLMIVPLLRFLQLQSSNKWVRRAMVASMFLCAMSIVGSYSRGALLGGGAMAGFLWLKSTKKLQLAIPLVFTVVFAVTFMPAEWFERMNTIKTYDQDRSALGRINAWWFAYNLANDRPVVGGGFQVFDAKLFEKYAPDPTMVHDAHSIYFEILAEQGYVGLFLFLGVWFLTMRAAGWVIRKARGDPELEWAADLVSMVQVGLIGYWIGGAFLGLGYFDLPYQMMAVVVVARMIVVKRLAERELATAKPAQNRFAARPSNTGVISPGVLARERK